MTLNHQDEFKDFTIRYYEKEPFVKLLFDETNEFLKVQQQLIYLMGYERYLHNLGFRKNKDGLPIEQFQYIKSNGFSNLYKFCMRNNQPLISCFLIGKKMISTETINSFSSTNELFKEIDYYFRNSSKEFIADYFSLLNVEILFKYPNLFPIKSFATIVKYPPTFIDRYFLYFNWNELMVTSKQQPPIEILLKYIENIDYSFIQYASSTYLTEAETQTLKLVKEML